MAQRIEVLHGRDPDGGCDIAVFVDGKLVEFVEETVDAGRGYQREDWDEHTESVREAMVSGDYSMAFGAAVLAWRDEPAGSKYIED